jgi:hypothetical protein
MHLFAGTAGDQAQQVRFHPWEAATLRWCATMQPACLAEPSILPLPDHSLGWEVRSHGQDSQAKAASSQFSLVAEAAYSHLMAGLPAAIISGCTWAWAHRKSCMVQS